MPADHNSVAAMSAEEQYQFHKSTTIAFFNPAGHHFTRDCHHHPYSLAEDVFH